MKTTIGSLLLYGLVSLGAAVPEMQYVYFIGSAVCTGSAIYMLATSMCVVAGRPTPKVTR